MGSWILTPSALAALLGVGSGDAPSSALRPVAPETVVAVATTRLSVTPVTDPVSGRARVTLGSPDGDALLCCWLSDNDGRPGPAASLDLHSGADRTLDLEAPPGGGQKLWVEVHDRERVVGRHCLPLG